MNREAALAELDGGSFDLLVVGGGITGAGVAREAARRGLRVALTEAGDFASGTSSRSTKLIHGGLRYLRSLDLRLVRESVTERQRLIQLAPHLVRPESFLLPVHAGDPDPLWQIRLGLWLYDRFAGRSLGHRRHRLLGPAEVAAEEPLLRTEGLLGGAIYTDAVTDDGQLTMAVVRSAWAAGAVAVNHCRLVGFVKDGGRVVGAHLSDDLASAKLDGRPPESRAAEADRRAAIEVRAAKVLNAAGPWADQVRRLDDPLAPRLLRLTKGVHLAFRRDRFPLRQAVAMRGTDGRLMFAVPHGDSAYAGTTDTPYGGDPGQPLVEAADAVYILAALVRNFPSARLGPDDVVSAWAGVRALVDPGDARHPSAISRDYQLFTSPSGLVTVAGGKLTAYRAMASAIVDRLFPATRGAAPDEQPLPTDALTAAAPGEGAAPAVRTRGQRAARVAEAARLAASQLMARRLDDVLFRRLPEALWSLDNGRGVAEAAAAAMGEVLGWDDARRCAEIERYLSLVAAMHAWRSGASTALLSGAGQLTS